MQPRAFICRVLRIQRRKNVVFLYVSGVDGVRQFLVDKDLFERHDIGIMSVLKGTYVPALNHQGQTVFQITGITEAVGADGRESYAERYTNRAVAYRLCRQEILDRICRLLERDGFLRTLSPFSVPFRGTSIATPLKIEGEFVHRYCKITHELALKQRMAEDLRAYYEVGYVARDQYETATDLFEYCILEFVSPVHPVGYLERFLTETFRTAAEVAEKYRLPYRDFSGLEIVDLEGRAADGVPGDGNVLFLHSPVASPLVKERDGKRTETIWRYCGKSMAHGYEDENDWETVQAFCRHQLEELAAKGIQGEYSLDFLETLRNGIPGSISFGMGIDRFFQHFFRFDHMKEYRQLLS